MIYGKISLLYILFYVKNSEQPMKQPFRNGWIKLYWNDCIDKISCPFWGEKID